MEGKQFWGKLQNDCVDNQEVNNFAKITLTCTVSKINAFLFFTQKFKIDIKNGGKMIFEKSRHMGRGKKFHKMYLPPFLR